jgi:acyl-CoA thioester hydrolase
MNKYSISLRAAYADTDQMGFVHHSNYVKYLEYARWEAFRQMGIPYKSIEDAGILMPVIEMQMKFKKPVRYDDIVKIELDFALHGSTRLEIAYKIFNLYGDLLHDATSTLAFLAKSSGRPCAIPDFIKEKIIQNPVEIAMENQTYNPVNHL